MRVNLKYIAIASVFALPALIVGCRSGFDVDLRNMTDEPVHARLVTPHVDGASLTLAETRLGPGSHGSLFKQVDYTQPVALEVDAAGSTGYPVTMSLARGKTIVNIKRIDDGARGLRLEETPRP
jgi:hypothetical protein